MKKHIPNFITCLNVLTGTLGVLAVVQGDLSDGFYYIMIAAFFDFLDGMVARVLGVQSEIGKQLDSLADVVSFGVLPALTMVELILKVQTNNYLAGECAIDFIPFIGVLIVAFSALRLAKFNLSEDQSDEFKGLPTPANAIMISSLASFPIDSLSEYYTVPLLAIIAIISCYLLVSNIPMIALKFKSLSWSGNELRYALIVVEVLGLVIFQLSFVPFVIPTYLVVSIVGNLLRKAVVS